MRHPGPLVLVAALLPLLLGVGPVAKKHTNPDLSNERYLSDLSGSSPNKRLYAARVLRSRAHQALDVYQSKDSGSLIYDDALATLEVLDDAVPVCVGALEEKRVGPVCADLLGFLEARPALDSLRKALDSHPGTCLARRARRAIERIEASPEEDPGAVPAPSPAPAELPPSGSP